MSEGKQFEKTQDDICVHSLRIHGGTATKKITYTQNKKCPWEDKLLIQDYCGVVTLQGEEISQLALLIEREETRGH